MKRNAITAASLLLLLGVCGCDEDDVGKACTPPAGDPVPPGTVGGETPVVEEVGLGRSNDCHSFQCLTHGGYAPYCTRPCTYEDGASGRACATDADCKRPLHCFAERCRDDDCPAGFECRTVQDVGPLQDELYCVYDEGCRDNRDCEALGDVACRRLGCFDQALLTSSPSEPHVLTCWMRSELTFCDCTEGGEACGGDQLVCEPSGVPAWPSNSVDVRTTCMPVR